MPEVNKNDKRSSASHGRRFVNLPFNGWTYFGYWQNGELYHGKPGLTVWQEVRRATPDEVKAKREAWKKSCENARLSGSEASSAIESALGYSIPVL